MSPMGIKQIKPLDADLFDEFEKLYFDDYEYLAPDNDSKEQNKQDFLNGKIENPTFTYSKLLTFNFEEKISEFNRLKEKAAKHENKTVQLAYLARIDEMLDQIHMLKAAKEKNDLKFYKYSVIIYDKPSLEIFEFDKARVGQIIKKAYKSGNKEAINNAKKIQSLFPDLSVSKQTQEMYKLLPPPINSDSLSLDSEEVKLLFEKEINRLKLDSWKVIIDNIGSRQNFSASQETKTIYIPNTIKLYKRSIIPTNNNIRALIAHELGTHAMRRENGENSQLRLLGLGLDRFLKGEEGLASYNYHQIEGANDFAAFRSHFSISLACGLDGKKRNFREVYEILKLYLLASLEGKLTKELLNKIESISWNTCVRCFRGTSCKTPGAVFTKGHIYREGNIEIYKLIKSNSKEVKRFMCGKYDPSNPRHTQILDKLDIT